MANSAGKFAITPQESLARQENAGGKNVSAIVYHCVERRVSYATNGTNASVKNDISRGCIIYLEKVRRSPWRGAEEKYEYG